MNRAALLAGLLAGSALSQRGCAQTTSAPPSDDGWPDLSSFLAEKYGFLPLVIPITEPAVGYGAAGGLAFLSRPISDAKAGFGRPDITFVGGMATENGSRGFFAGDIRNWLGDRLQTRAFVLDGSINLDFFGVGSHAGLEQRPLHYNLEPRGTSLEARARISESPWWTGLGFQLARIEVSFEEPAGTPGVPSFQSEADIGGLLPSLTYDSRDNMFTPTTGSYLEASAGVYGKFLGSDQDFQRVTLLALTYRPLGPRLWLGLRGEGSASFGDVPFYLRPYVGLRGVPMLRYQGEVAATAEVELRWQFWNRISLVGFGGGGVAWNDLERLADSTGAVAGGVGLRYELAREYGIHAGFDVAVGPEDVALYFQVGSAWVRP